MADGFFARSYSEPNEAKPRAETNLGSPEVPDCGSDLWFYRGVNTKSVKSTDITEQFSSALEIVSTKDGNKNAAKAIELFGDSIVVPAASAPHESQGRASEVASNSSSLSNLGSVVIGHDVGLVSVEKAAGAAEAADENDDSLLRTLLAKAPTACVSEESESGTFEKDECVRSGCTNLLVIQTSEDRFVINGSIEYAENASEDWLKYRDFGSLNEVARIAVSTDEENLVMASSKSQLNVAQRFGSHDRHDCRENVPNKPATSECDAAVSNVTADIRRLGEDLTIERTFKARDKDGDPAVRAVKFKKDVAFLPHSGSPTNIKAGQEVILKEVETRCYREIEVESLKLLSGQSVPAFYAVGRSKSRTIIAEESVNGELLYDVMQQSKETRISEHFSYRSSSALFEAYKMLHKNNIAHLDIKPKNVILRKNDNEINGINAARPFQACILDFGLSRHMRSRKFMDNPERILCGTPAFMSPQMAENIMRKHRNLEVVSEQAALQETNRACRIEVIGGSMTFCDAADGSRTSDGSRGGGGTTEQKGDLVEPVAVQIGASAIDDSRASEAARDGDNIAVRSVMKTEGNELEQKQAGIGILVTETVKAPTKCERGAQQKSYLSLSRNIDAASIALTLYAVARGRPFFELKERTFKERVRERSKLESAKFDESTGELVESSFVKELSRLQSDDVSDEDRRRFPKRFVQLLIALYVGRPDPFIANILRVWYKDAFSGDSGKATYLRPYVNVDDSC